MSRPGLGIGACLPLLLLGSACGERGPAAESDRALVRACEFLWSQQAADGGWHSEHYGAMRGGQSLTALVLSVLVEVPEADFPRDPAAIVRGAGFLVRNLDSDGALGTAGPVPDYPNYASGLAIKVLAELGDHPAAVARLRRYLLGQQLREDLGWTADHPAFGAWGMGGAERRVAVGPGHVDLSMTRIVLQGLAALWPPPTEALERSHVFLDRCIGNGGGFFFSTVVLGANKAGRSQDGFQSYGSTTADGILSLLATGVGIEDVRVRRARDWLVARHRIDRVPGIPAATRARWGTGLRFYYLAASAEALSRLGMEEAPPGQDWRVALTEALAQNQLRDGSWANPEGQLKEDDPLIATALGLRALVAARIR